MTKPSDTIEWIAPQDYAREVAEICDHSLDEVAEVFLAVCDECGFVLLKQWMKPLFDLYKQEFDHHATGN